MKKPESLTIAKLTTCILSGLVLSMSSYAQPLGSAQDWLEKMINAKQHESYSGVFTFIRGKDFNTMRISHENREGLVRENIYQLNGVTRNLLRNGDEIVCYHDATEPGELEHDLPLGPFSQSFSELLTSFQGGYQLALHGRGRVADRSAVQLSVQPRDSDRYGYRLWIDEATGLLLQSHLIGSGRIREIFQFSQVSIGEPISDEVFSDIPANAVSHHMSVNLKESDTEPSLSEPSFKVKWLPSGFKTVRTSGNRLHFSDGVATFSIFIAKAKRLPEMATEVNGRAVVTKLLRGGNGQITIVGNVPVQMAKKVAESVEPVIY
jgi:sigma-E factor negative regulatory protein RseB